MEQDKAKLLLKADAYIAFLVEQGKVFTYLPQGQTGIFGTVYQPRPAELYPGLQGAMDYCLLFKTRRLLGAQTTWIDLPDYLTSCSTTCMTHHGCEPRAGLSLQPNCSLGLAT